MSCENPQCRCWASMAADELPMYKEFWIEMTYYMPWKLHSWVRGDVATYMDIHGKLIVLTKDQMRDICVRLREFNRNDRRRRKDDGLLSMP